MACTTEKTTSFSVKVDSKPTVNKRFYVEVERCGTAGTYSFKTVVKRKCGINEGGCSDNEIIGRTTSTGFILLSNLSQREEREEKYIKDGIKQAFTTAKNFAIGNDLTDLERTFFLNQLGFKNNADESEINHQSDTTEGTIYEGQNVAADLPYEVKIDQGFGILSTVSVQGRKARTSYGNYYYPEDLASNKQDRIKFTMGYSEGTEVEASLVNQKSFQKKLKSISGSVTLPIVTGISDQSSVDWKGAELNPLQSFAAAGALDLFNEAKKPKANLATLGTKAGDIVMTAKQDLVDSGVGDAINVWLAQKAVGAQNLLSRTTGAIVNPNLEMLFNAPQLRNFGFSFLLSPRDADEATQVRNIIRFFKQGMSVKTTNSNVFLKAPNIFAIKYMTYNTDGEEILHPSINIIKTCALLSMDVQYTPNGTYMTYEDPFRTMQAYQLTMQFGELDPIYDNDYTDLDNDNDTVIGY